MRVSALIVEVVKLLICLGPAIVLYVMSRPQLQLIVLRSTHILIRSRCL